MRKVDVVGIYNENAGQKVMIILEEDINEDEVNVLFYIFLAIKPWLGKGLQ